MSVRVSLLRRSQLGFDGGAFPPRLSSERLVPVFSDTSPVKKVVQIVSAPDNYLQDTGQREVLCPPAPTDLSSTDVTRLRVEEGRATAVESEVVVDDVSSPKPSR